MFSFMKHLTNGFGGPVLEYSPDMHVSRGFDSWMYIFFSDCFTKGWRAYLAGSPSSNRGHTTLYFFTIRGMKRGAAKHGCVGGAQLPVLKLISLKRWCEQRTSGWRGQNPLVKNKIYLFDSVWQPVTLCGIFYWFIHFFPHLVFSLHLHRCKPLKYMASMVKYSPSTRATPVQKIIILIHCLISLLTMTSVEAGV
jgi:hypothetical protein